MRYDIKGRFQLIAASTLCPLDLKYNKGDPIMVNPSIEAKSAKRKHLEKTDGKQRK